MLEVMKNALFGRLQYPHPYFIEKGVHSISLVTQNDSKKDLDQKEVVTSLMRTLEVMVRGMDQLDEQLHAGYYFYIFTSTGSFIENGQFVWGFALILVGISIPIVLHGASH